MKSNVKINERLSQLLVAFFFLFLSFFAVFAELFKTQIQELDIAQIYVNPVPINDLSRLKFLTLKNKNGEFVFENTHPDGSLQGPWQMTSPQILSSKDLIIEKMITSLKNLKIRNLHLYEPINVSSFSIDNPTFEISLVAKNNKIIDIKQGLINPIDDSSYLGISGQDHIYQVDLLDLPLENFDLAQLADSQVLALNEQALSSVEISHQKRGITLSLMKKEENWITKGPESLSQDKVHQFIKSLASIKSRSILSNLTEEQSNALKALFNEPLWSLKILQTSSVKNYYIAPMPKKFPGVSQDLKSAYIISNFEKKSFIIVDSKEVFFLKTTERKLK